jgi:hypothetical protein
MADEEFCGFRGGHAVTGHIRSETGISSRESQIISLKGDTNIEDSIGSL